MVVEERRGRPKECGLSIAAIATEVASKGVVCPRLRYQVEAAEGHDRRSAGLQGVKGTLRQDALHRTIPQSEI